MKFNYCPKCGAKLIEKNAGDDGLVPYCQSCEMFFFEMFPCCSIILVVNEYDEIALIKQEYISHKYMNLVAGYIKPGENAQETAVREVQEEIGQAVEKLWFVSSNWFAKKGILMEAFIARVKKRDFKLSVEVEDAIWVEPKEGLSLVHPHGSLSSMLIEHFIENEDKYKM